MKTKNLFSLSKYEVLALLFFLLLCLVIGIDNFKRQQSDLESLHQSCGDLKSLTVSRDSLGLSGSLDLSVGSYDFSLYEDKTPSFSKFRFAGICVSYVQSPLLKIQYAQEISRNGNVLIPREQIKDDYLQWEGVYWFWFAVIAALFIVIRGFIGNKKQD